MVSITIQLPASMKQFVAEQTAKGGFNSEGAYLQTLVRQAQIRAGRQELEAKLTNGLESPASEMTAADWEELKQRVRQSAQKAHGP